MDFIIGLSSFQNHTVVLVIANQLSKAVHFGMLTPHFTTAKVAGLFAKLVCSVHDMPKNIVLDYDPIFMSQFWQELFKLSGNKLRMSSSYRHQSDGQIEIVNKTLQQYLHFFAHHQPKQWGKFHNWAEWHYNTAIHDATGVAPYQVIFGKSPPNLPQYIEGTGALEVVQTELLTREHVLQLLK